MTMMAAGTSDNMYDLETVSLNDDDQKPVSIDIIESQRPAYANGKAGAKDVNKSHGDSEHPNGRGDEDEQAVVVVVDKPRPVPPTLPPLRVMDLSRQFGPDGDDGDGDYVDTTLFSPEVSRQAMDQANRRARTLENELKELSALDHVTSAASSSGSPVKITPQEAVTIISSAFVTSLAKAKALVTGQDAEYDLLGGSSPQNKMDDLDTDGDGLQLSPDASKGDGKHFQSPRIKPALKRISAYSAIEKEIKVPQPNKPRRTIAWHDDVLDQDEEFVDDGNDEDDEESEMLMVNGGKPGNSAIANRQATPRSKKKRKKLVRSMMRRLTPREKEELYRQRPDLMIVPNWAQKYREEMTEAESSRWSFWLISIIGTLVVLLVILIMLIARDKAGEVKK
jgi:hypothetical protein